jgi:deoxyribodipyrimidine photo-lyase
VYWASDVSPYARTRDRAVTDALGSAGVQAVPMPGNFAADVSRPRTKNGRPFVVFTPFRRAWEQLDRRRVHDAPDAVAAPAGLDAGALPSLSSLGLSREVHDGAPAGEAAARAAMGDWLSAGIAGYDTGHDRLAGATSGLSPYLRFGLLSARELEERTMALAGSGPAAFRRQLAWREFYAHVLLTHPGNAREEFQPRYRALEWEDDRELLVAWCEGRTGYPIVDAGMRQLRRTGFMHNRARMIVGSFLTKDLHLDWRAGEAHFMRYLLDGDEAQNNGNWQWIASVGVDPAPYFRRIFNPVLQQRKFDAEGEYVRRWVPELSSVPDRRLAEPWLMTAEEQAAAGCVIGRDYPEPVVDHRRERLRAIERYRAVAAAGRDG